MSLIDPNQIISLAPSQNVGQPTVPFAPGSATAAIYDRDLDQDVAGSIMQAATYDPTAAAKAIRLSQETRIPFPLAQNNYDDLAHRQKITAWQQTVSQNPTLAPLLRDPEFAAVAQDDSQNVGWWTRFKSSVTDLNKAREDWWFETTKDISSGILTGIYTTQRGRALQARPSLTAEQRDEFAGLQEQYLADPAAAAQSPSEYLLRAGLPPEQAESIIAKGRTISAIGPREGVFGTVLSSAAEIGTQVLMGIVPVAREAALGASVGGAAGAIGGPLAPISVPAGMALGATAGAATGRYREAFRIERGNQIASMVDMGVDLDDAWDISFFTGNISAALELTGAGIVVGAPVRAIAKNLMSRQLNEAIQKPTTRAALRNGARVYAQAVAGETATEVAQEVNAIIGEEIGLVLSGRDGFTEESMRQGMTRIVDTAIHVAAGMAVLGVPGAGATLYSGMRASARMQREQNALTQIAQNAKDTKFRADAPTVYERLAASQLNGTSAETTYIDAERVKEVLDQAGLTPAEIDQVLPGVRQQLPDALASRGDVTIPTAKWAANTVGTKIEAALLPHMRLSAKSMSPVEAAAFQAEREQLVAEASQILEQKQAVDAEWTRQAKDIADTIRQQAVAVRGMTETDADVFASGVQAFYVTKAVEMGMTPEQLFRLAPYTIQGEAAGVSLEQASRLMYPSLAKAWDSYTSGERYMTIGDLADKIESLDLAGKRIPQSVLDAVQEFRNAQREEREIYGERGGTEDDAGNALEIAVQNATEQMREEELPPNIMEQAARKSDIGHKREKATGRYVGAPDWVGGDPAKLRILRNRLRQLAKEGEVGKEWYERSSRAILNAVGGDIVEAEKLVALIAIYSPNATVSKNMTMALTAYYQFKAGLPIKAGLGASNQKATDLLVNNKRWDGIKTNSFYQNLMVEIDPSYLDMNVATMDMWMAIAFDYGDKSLDQGPKYKFTEREIQRLAEELGWKPHQVQAAIWTAMKGRVDPIREDLKQEEVRRGIGEVVEETDPKTGKKTQTYKIKAGKKREHFKLAYEMAMARASDPAALAESKYDFSDAINERLIQLSWEATPSTSANAPLPGIHSAPLEQKIEYLNAIVSVLNQGGRDRIAELAGIPQGRTITGISAWDAAIGAGAQTFIPAPLEGAGARRVIKPVAESLIRLAAAIRGYVLNQDAVFYHTPMFDSAVKSQNGIQLLTQRGLTDAEMRQLYDALNAKFNTWELAPGYLDRGVRILNFVDGLDNKAFHDGFREILTALPDDFGGGIMEFGKYRSVGGAVFSNWKDNPNGEIYREIITARSPDLLRRVDDLRSDVEAVNRRFADKYGWGERRLDARERGAVGDRVERAAIGALSPLAGAPRINGFTGPDPAIVAIAERYAAERGIPFRRQAEYADVDTARAQRIAAAYDAMRHDPSDPQVAKAYKELIDQTRAQYDALVAGGYQFYFFDPANDPYANQPGGFGNPYNAVRDLRANKRMAVYPTESGFGSGVTDVDVSNSPLLADTGLQWPFGSPTGQLKRVTANDLFRAVHDSFGHSLEGAGFRARGEENAWQAHVRLFTGAAVGAMTSETRGQNSWLNFGPFGSKNQTAKIEDTTFADQKVGLMPSWTWTEGVVADEPIDPALAASQRAVRQMARSPEARGDVLFQAAAAGGPRGGFDPRTLTTFINKGGDLSTWIHETAHFHFTVLGRLASRADAPESIRADMDTLLQWGKVDGATPEERLATWNAMTVDQQKKLHEQFAYSWEVYQFEGKAPSVEMQGVFERFRMWLMRVYKSVLEINAVYRSQFGEDLPALTPEVRQVMDRMLATQEQIERQQAINQMIPSFQSQDESGMSDAEWAAYQKMQAEATEAAVTDLGKASLSQMEWLSGARSRLLKQMQTRNAKARREMRDEVSRQVRSDPTYRALRYIRTGKIEGPDGAEIVVDGPHKLSTAGVKEIIDALPMDRLIDLNMLPEGVMAENGRDPDLVASDFGFDSGDALLRAMVGMRSLEDEINARTDARLLAENALMSPEQMEEEVQRAIHNEARARFVAVEQRWLERLDRPARIILEAAKQAARAKVAGTLVRDLRPQQWIAAESKAARDARLAYSNRRTPEEIGRSVYTRVYNDQEAAGTGLVEAQVIAEAARVKAVADAQARLDAFRAAYPEADPAAIAIRAKRAQTYNNQMAAQTLEAKAEIEKAVVYLRRVLRAENRKKMGADYADQIEGILERFDLAAISADKARARQALAEWLEGERKKGLDPELPPVIADEAERKPYKNMTVAEFRELADAVRTLEYMGKNTTKILLAGKRLEFEATRDRIVENGEENAERRGRKAKPPVSVPTKLQRRIEAIRGYHAAQLTPSAIIQTIDGGEDGPLSRYLLEPFAEQANFQTEQRVRATEFLDKTLRPIIKSPRNRPIVIDSIGRSMQLEERLVVALNYGNDGNARRLLVGEDWTEAQVADILATLTTAELEAVQRIWDFFETFRPMISAKERRLTGKDLEYVDRRELTVPRTADGQSVTLPGGYYPIRYDPRRSTLVQAIDEVEEAKRMMDGARTASTTSDTFKKKRSQNGLGKPLTLTMNALYSGVNEVIDDLSWQEWLIAANRLMRDGKFAKMVRERYGDAYYQQLREWISTVAVGDRVASSVVENMAVAVRQNVSVSAMAWRAITAGIQITGIFPAAAKIGTINTLRGLTYLMTSPRQASERAREKSKFMANRGRTRYRDLNEIRNLVRGETGIRRNYMATAYAAIGAMQSISDNTTWWGRYEAAKRDGRDEDTAVFLADQAVKDTQGSGLTGDLSSVMRGGKAQSPYVKLFTSFMQYSNTMYSLTSERAMTANGRGDLAARLFLILIPGAILEELIRNLLTAKAEEDEPEELVRRLAANQLDYLIGLPFGIRELTGIGDVLLGVEPRYQYRGPSGLRAISATGQLVNELSQGEFDAGLRRSLINFVGITTGAPSTQINATIDGINAVMEGEAEGADVILAPITGFKTR